MLKSKAKKCKTQGFGMIEIIIAATIISLALASLAFLGNFAIRIQTHLKQNLIATNLAVEAMEAARAVKEENWTNFSALELDTPYHPQKGGAPLKWFLVSGAEIINGLSRQVVFSQVFRDDNDDIADIGMSDSGTRKITATVSWNERGNNYEVKLESYLTNLK
jgi:type II secretory pathway pseudopilin PulG